MPTEDSVPGMDQVAIKDPYTGLHPESVFAIWHDPTTYDLLKHGPPYLPEQTTTKVAATTTRGKALVKQLKDAVRPLVEKTAADSITALLILGAHIAADFADMPMAGFAGLVAALRAESMLHQAHHWQSRGDSFYGDHLMFERLYSNVIGDLDKLAERMVGSGHPVLASPLLHAKHVSAFVQIFYDGAPPSPGPDQNVLLSLRAALHTLVMLKLVYAKLNQQGLLSHGIDNLLQGIADNHEEHVYLLKQRAMQKSSSYDRRKVSATDPRWKLG